MLKKEGNWEQLVFCNSSLRLKHCKLKTLVPVLAKIVHPFPLLFFLAMLIIAVVVVIPASSLREAQYKDTLRKQKPVDIILWIFLKCATGSFCLYLMKISCLQSQLAKQYSTCVGDMCMLIGNQSDTRAHWCMAPWYNSSVWSSFLVHHLLKRSWPPGFWGQRYISARPNVHQKDPIIIFNEMILKYFFTV